MQPNNTQPPIVLYDGVCGLCNGVVQFIIRRDRRKTFRFAPLQSDAGQALLERFGMPKDSLDSFVLIEDNRVYTKSTAALRLCKRMPGLWTALYVGIAVPRPVRDAVYDWIARNRYRWFGKKDACMLPSREWRDRFLE
jgi:predicted DCC family thiol-disulfide oxidoreductase YuxK